LARYDWSKDYSPENCYFITRERINERPQQNIMLSHMGKTQNLKRWSDELNIAYTTLWRRYYAGWTEEEILTTPVKQKLKRRKQKRESDHL